MGILLSEHGTGPTEEKGLVKFSPWFIPDVATKAEPLRVLCRKEENFVRGKEEEEDFNTLIEKSSHTGHCRRQPDWTWHRPGTRSEWAKSSNLLASRSRNDTERRYSQTMKEAYALVWACQRFTLYVYGLPEFDLMTDHQALKTIYSPRSKPSARIERWVLRLQPYNYWVRYFQGEHWRCTISIN